MVAVNWLSVRKIIVKAWKLTLGFLQLLVDAFSYSAVYFLCGLLQLFILLSFKLLSGESDSDILIMMKEILETNRNAILFFCSAAVCAPSIDYLFLKEREYSKYSKILILFVLPAAIVFAVMVVFCYSVFNTTNEKQELMLNNIMYLCFVFTLAHVLFSNILKIFSKKKLKGGG